METLLKDGIAPSDPLLANLIKHYNICKIGMMGRGFNWQEGCWGKAPMWLVEMMLVIDTAINEHTKDSQAVSNLFD